MPQKNGKCCTFLIRWFHLNGHPCAISAIVASVSGSAAEGLGLQLQAPIAARDIGREPYVEDMKVSYPLLRLLTRSYKPEFPADVDIRRSEPIRAAYAGGRMLLYGDDTRAKHQHPEEGMGDA